MASSMPRSREEKYQSKAQSHTILNVIRRYLATTACSFVATLYILFIFNTTKLPYQYQMNGKRRLNERRSGHKNIVKMRLNIEDGNNKVHNPDQFHGKINDEEEHLTNDITFPSGQQTPKKATVKREKNTSRKGDTDKINTQKTNGKKKIRIKRSRPIRRIALLGERHSGTTWLTSELKKCFPSLNVTSRLTRWKHWFQDDDHKGHFHTLVISLFRNPYEWTEAMRQGPHHAPNHLYLNWTDFVTKEWSMERPKRDLEAWEQSGNDTVCQQKFKYHEINSCVKGDTKDDEFVQLQKNIPHHTTYSGFKPFYELKRDGSGEAYKSILDLRAAKIKNYLSVKEWYWVEDSIPIQYEKLVSNGTDFLLRLIEDKVRTNRACEATPHQVKNSRILKQKYVDWMTENVDWESESLIGYGKWGEDEGEIIEKDLSDTSASKMDVLSIEPKRNALDIG